MERMERDTEFIRTNLETLFPHEANYGSRASLFGKGLENKIITQEEYNKAREYYGKLWFYVGD